MDILAETPIPSSGTHVQPTIGLALGAGGARGFAHVPVLEAFDELGLKPAIIAGSSMGALIGAAYAAGMTGRDIRDYALHLADNRAQVLNRLWGLRPASMRDALGGFRLLLLAVGVVVDALQQHHAPMSAVEAAVGDVDAALPRGLLEGWEIGVRVRRGGDRVHEQKPSRD